jgi:putative colanic acid biosynthesis UDP-glucose lipid carrier transferase
MLHALEMAVGPLALVLSLWFIAWWVDGTVNGRYVILSVIVFSLTFPASARLSQGWWSVVRRIVVGWIGLASVLLLAGYASGYLDYFSRDVLVAWLWLAPASELAAQFGLRAGAPAILELQGRRRRAIVAGMNTQGVELARRLAIDPYSSVQVIGFFDDRESERIDPQNEHHLLGSIADLPRYARDEKIELIYIALPMASQPRIRQLLEDLHDTTASIYFVPDIFVTDLIQGRMDAVGGLPIVAVCETPFTGLSGVTKRLSDIILSLLILALIAIPMAVIALAIKLTSLGPVIFTQRRYGVDGREIVVYKFRTMTVLEDGAQIEQASPGDPRITRVGRLLRRLSLDELPQFFNVLQGRMSIVGPRPHAVAHNEMYRKLIKGYMLRHKVKPGITGWAQVNGYRGETKDLDAMRGRIEYDLDYLRNWSLRFDLYIIAKTVGVVLSGKNAH